jgi:hypothetical protein
MQLQSVMLYLLYYFYKITFKIKHKLYIASGSAPPQRKILGAQLMECHNFSSPWSRSMSSAGHVARVEVMRNAYKIVVEKA